MHLPWLVFIVFFAFTTEAIVGFGSTVLTVTLGAHLLPIDTLLPAFIPLNIALSAVLLARNVRQVAGGVLLRHVLPGVGVGLVAGLLLFRLQGAWWLRLVFGAFVVLLALLELARLARDNTSGSEPLPLSVSGPLLAFGGLIHGLFGSGGPMIVYVLSRRISDRGAMRATLAALWLMLNAALLVNYATLGLLDASSMRRSAALLPALVAGLFLGDRLHGRLPERVFRYLVYLVLLAAGGSLVARTLLA